MWLLLHLRCLVLLHGLKLLLCGLLLLLFGCPPGCATCFCCSWFCSCCCFCFSSCPCCAVTLVFTSASLTRASFTRLLFFEPFLPFLLLVFFARPFFCFFCVLLVVFFLTSAGLLGKIGEELTLRSLLGCSGVLPLPKRSVVCEPKGAFFLRCWYCWISASLMALFSAAILWASPSLPGIVVAAELAGEWSPLLSLTPPRWRVSHYHVPMRMLWHVSL